MPSARAITVLLAAAGALAACGPKPLTANDMPRPRPGHWHLTGIRNGTPLEDDMCLSGAHVHVPVGDQSCPQKSWSRASDGAYELAVTCQTDPSTTMRITERYAGDFQQSYTLAEHDTVSYTDRPPIVVDTQFTYRFDGPCPPGSKADDLF
jgi:uncharacterized protein DUF3617